MRNDVRYSEFLLLCALERGDEKFKFISVSLPGQTETLGLHQRYYMQMVLALAEDAYIVFDQQNLQFLIGRLRGEIASDFPIPSGLHGFEWGNPRDCLENAILGNQALRVEISYRGLRRIEELRDLLKRDRILEPAGVLLDMRYFRRDFEDALRRSAEIPVSVLRLDMDNFRRINNDFGHAAGDVVMKSYLEAVRDSLGSHGDGYRGLGDEVATLIVGQGHQRATQIAEKIRLAVKNMRCEFNGVILPLVTVSIGVATSPPESRGVEMESLADSRQIQAKRAGKDCVIHG